VAITQAELIEELKRRGYGAITRRWMSSARGKGLVPKLTHQGRGRGIGSRYLILDPETVIEQTITVYELLRLHNRTETALLSTWFAGFEMPIKRVRKCWIARMDKEKSQIEQRAQKARGRENVIFNLANYVARGLAPKHKLEFNATSEVIQEVLNSIYDPKYEFDVEANFEPFVDVIVTIIGNKNGKRETPDFLTEENLISSMDFFRQSASLKYRRELISSAKDEELVLAHQLWRRIGNFVRQFAIKKEPQLFSGPGIPFSRQSAISFGGVGILLLLYLTKFDSNSSMSRTVDLLEKLTGIPNFPEITMETKNPGTVPNEIETQISKLRDELYSIWENFNFETFKREIALHADQIDQS
jgi:hypothetical protein